MLIKQLSLTGIKMSVSETTAFPVSATLDPTNSRPSGPSITTSDTLHKTFVPRVSELQSPQSELNRLEMDRKRIISNQIVRRKKISNWIFDSASDGDQMKSSCAILPSDVRNLQSECTEVPPLPKSNLPQSCLNELISDQEDENKMPNKLGEGRESKQSGVKLFNGK